MDTSEEISALLQRFRLGDDSAQSLLMRAVGGELRLMAARYMARERANHTLQTTALVNEAYLKLVRVKSTEWKDRIHFFAVAARIMRHILVDHARQHAAHGPDGISIDIIPLQEGLVFHEQRSRQLVQLDEALERLSQLDERAGRVIELRFFGLTVAETAGVLQTSRRAVERDWTFGRAWLRDQLATDNGHADGLRAIG